MTAHQAVVQAMDEDGQPRDLTELFDRYKVRAFHFALQMVGNRDDAMELTQEAFLRLHREWRRRDPARSLVGWLYAVLRNLSIDQLRKRTVRNQGAGENESIVLDGNPEALAVQRELARRVWSAIDALPPEQREVLILRDWHGLSYGEIAQATGISTSTVTSRLHDARQRMRKQIARYL